MLWDLFQQFQIGQLNQKIDREVDRAEDVAVDSAARSVMDLEERVSRLALICRAMFELMEESAPGLTEEKLSAKVTEIDLRDGVADGQMTPKGKPCPKCGATMSPKFGRCLFCGYKDSETVRFT